MTVLTEYKYTTIDRMPEKHRRIARLATLGLAVAQIAAIVEASTHVVRSVLAHPVAQQYQMTLQAEATLDWMKYTERFDRLMEKSLTVVEAVLDADMTPTKKRWAVEFCADRDPKRRVPKRTAQEVQHSHRLEGLSSEDIDELNRRGRELMNQSQKAIDVEVLEVPVETDEEENAGRDSD